MVKIEHYMQYKKLIWIFCLILPMTISAQSLLELDTIALKSINGIIRESHRLITTQPGKTLHPEALRPLFLPGAQFTVLYHNDDMPFASETVSVDEFIDLLKDPYYEEGYIEYETGKVINEYNGIANVFQSFYAKDSEGVEARGINSYQLLYFDDRWWIANMLWTVDDNGVPVPEKYIEP